MRIVLLQQGMWYTLLCAEIIFNQRLYADAEALRRMNPKIHAAVHSVSLATSSSTANTLVKRDGSGDFSANVITATLDGNASSATNFSGSLSGDVTGGQSSTVVATVGGQAASNIANTVTTVATATSSNTPSTLVLRDGSGNFIMSELTVQALQAQFNPSVANGTPLSTSLSNPTDLVFTPDNKFLMVLNGSEAGSVSVFAVDSTNGTLSAIDGSPFSFEHLISPYELAISPDGRFLAVSTPTNTHIVILAIDPATGALTEAASSPFNGSASAYFLAYAPNGKYLAVGDQYNHTIRIMSVNSATGGLTEAEGSPFSAHAPYTLKFSPDGNFLAAADASQNTLSIYAINNTTGALSEISGSPYTVGSSPYYVAYSPNGKFLSVSNAGDYTIYTFGVDTQTGTLTYIGQMFGYAPEELSYSTDSQYLVTSALGQPPHGYISIYSVNQDTGAMTNVSGYSEFEIGIYPYRMTFSPNGNFLGILSTYDSEIAVVTNMASQIFVDQSFSINGNLTLPATGDVAGIISLGGDHFIHNAGTNNTFLGEGAGNLSITGTNNVGIGTHGLCGCTSGSNNVALGSGAGVSLTSGSNNVYIAADAGSGSESDTIRIGDQATQCFMSGINGVTSTSGVAVLVNTNGQLGTTTSSQVYKEEIKDMGDLTPRLMAMRPVTFKYKQEIDPSGLLQYGLLAEQIVTLFPELVTYNAQGKPEAIRYHELSPILLNGYQQQQKQIEILEQKIAALEKKQK